MKKTQALGKTTMLLLNKAKKHIYISINLNNSFYIYKWPWKSFEKSTFRIWLKLLTNENYPAIGSKNQCTWASGLFAMKSLNIQILCIVLNTWHSTLNDVQLLLHDFNVKYFSFRWKEMRALSQWFTMCVHQLLHQCSSYCHFKEDRKAMQFIFTYLFFHFFNFLYRASPLMSLF